MKRQIDIQVLKYSHVILKYMLSQIYIQICNMKKVYHKKVVRQVWKYLIKIRNLILSYYHCLLMKIICPLFKTLISQINWKLYLKYRMFKRCRISSDVFSSHFANQCLKIIQIDKINSCVRCVSNRMHRSNDGFNAGEEYHTHGWITPRSKGHGFFAEL